ncbi:IPT/TIG domain-containing protein [Nitritalea halalkaliphila]|uniref:IPT/TIG domain-containing protein n=1 Tax=Nitritalea halalkaliphila TaxID=590849 RepID=UPI00058BD943|nr:IPT/TIG domain-containing protein [Nitritalea halalkaliphila]
MAGRELERLSLGASENPGRFIGEFSGLQLRTSYSVAAFILQGEQERIAPRIEFQTLDPDITSFSPNNGPAGTVVQIVGRNLTADTRVFFGEREAEVLSLRFESLLSVRVPPAGEQPEVPIRIVAQGEERQLEALFRYPRGRFEEVNTLSNTLRLANGNYFQRGTQFFYLNGANRNTFFIENHFRYDGAGGGEWISGDLLPERPLWMAFQTENYLGGGSATLSRAPFTPAFDFYQITETGSLQPLASLPFIAVQALAFELNGRLYVCGGNTGLSQREVHRYTPETGSWVRLQNAPFDLHGGLFHFVFEGSAYVIREDNRSLVRFDAAAEDWIAEDIFPGELGGGFGFAKVQEGRVLLGLANRSRQVWEYFPKEKNWVRARDFSGAVNALNVGVYQLNNSIYLLRSPEVQIPGAVTLWELDPNGF